jgi:hypothetical protein
MRQTQVSVDHHIAFFMHSQGLQYIFLLFELIIAKIFALIFREEKVKHRILRIFKIWDERGIYDEAFISDLSGLLSTTTKKTATETVTDTSDFQARRYKLSYVHERKTFFLLFLHLKNFLGFTSYVNVCQHNFTKGKM